MTNTLSKDVFPNENQRVTYVTASVGANLGADPLLLTPSSDSQEHTPTALQAAMHKAIAKRASKRSDIEAHRVDQRIEWRAAGSERGPQAQGGIDPAGGVGAKAGAPASSTTSNFPANGSSAIGYTYTRCPGCPGYDSGLCCSHRPNAIR